MSDGSSSKKAWDLYRQTARFPVETIHTATIWLEEKYHKAPAEKIAMAITLHYLILALRCDSNMESPIAQEYCGRAAGWRAKACEPQVVSLSAKPTENN